MKTFIPEKNQVYALINHDGTYTLLVYGGHDGKHPIWYRGDRHHLSLKESPQRRSLLISFKDALAIFCKGITTNLQIRRELHLPEHPGVLSFLKDMRTTLTCSNPPVAPLKQKTVTCIRRVLGLPHSFVDAPSVSLVNGMIELLTFRGKLNYLESGSWSEGVKQLGSVREVIKHLNNPRPEEFALEQEVYRGIDAPSIIGCKVLAIEYTNCEPIAILTPHGWTYGVAIGPHRRRLDTCTPDLGFRVDYKGALAFPTRRLPKERPTCPVSEGMFLGLLDQEFREAAANAANVHWRARALARDSQKVQTRTVDKSSALIRLGLLEVFDNVPKEWRQGLILAATAAGRLAWARGRIEGFPAPSLSSIVSSGRFLLGLC